MSNINEKIGLKAPNILMPNKSEDLSKWAVVACDQYTSEPAYWKEVEEIVGEEPSTLKVIFPEVYLEEGAEREQRIKNINNTMKKYIDEKVLVEQKPGFIYIDRKTSHAESRKGLIVAVDLEKYDYNKGSQTLIRATEGTVLDRLPPRTKVRENASLELPHIMILIDDINETVVEPIAKISEKLEKLYDVDLMMNGGHIKGYAVNGEKFINNIYEALEKLADAQNFKAKYGVSDDKGVLLFAVGDGNHSLASAKLHYENLKKKIGEKESQTHPARYALVEIVNVHDKGLEFEPIHRVVFGADLNNMLDEIVEFYDNLGIRVEVADFASKSEADSELKNLNNLNDGNNSVLSNIHYLPFSSGNKFGIIKVYNPKNNLEVGTLQTFLDDYVKNNSSVKIDYIHGENVVATLSKENNNIGFYLPPMDKQDLFKTVILDGVLPRKTFSMGEAEEKRFYMEARKIVE
jgi:uncharacterized protein (DUF1015 family)